jgi:hypothetical protein
MVTYGHLSLELKLKPPGSHTSVHSTRNGKMHLRLFYLGLLTGIAFSKFGMERVKSLLYA